MVNTQRLAIVVPCFNEEEVLPQTKKNLSNKLTQLVSENKISSDSFILFIDDGSTDNTWKMIENYQSENPQLVAGLKLDKNLGHQKALLCGLLEAIKTADVTITMDADMQDDITVIDEMLSLFYSGCEIVCGIRRNRKADGILKRISAYLFYAIMRILGKKLIANHADFRLMSKNAVTVLEIYRDKNVFLRGIVPKLGLRIDTVYYDRSKRLAGKTKYTLYKMIKLALSGIRNAASPRQ